MIRKGAISLLFLVAVPAFADWQYAKWGMTPEQVIAASKGLASSMPDPSTDESKEAYVVFAPFQAGGKDFKVTFGFNKNSHKLSKIHIAPKNVDDCLKLRDLLIDKYGKPEMNDTSKARGGELDKLRWRDTVAKNKLEFSDMTLLGHTFCGVDYTSLTSAENNGL